MTGVSLATKLSAYRDSIGRPSDELLTPALLLDLPALRRNIETMAAFARGRVGIRPHAKTHKCAEIARLQVDAGAIGCTVATIWEALALADAGIDDLLIANQVVAPEKIDLVAGLAGRASVTIAVDDPTNAAALAAAARRAGSEIGVLVEVDVGMGRAGVRSAGSALELAAVVAGLEGLRLRGVMGYEGHAVLEPDRERRRSLARSAMAYLGEVVEFLAGHGFSVEVVSAGGTNTFDATGASAPVTELQVGTYALMDSTYSVLTPEFEPALRIVATCVSSHGDRAVLDCGTKVIPLDLGPPRALQEGVRVVRVHEEHVLLDLDGRSLGVGERLELVPAYCGGTVNLNEVYYVVEAGTILDIWPIVARGSGRAGPDRR